MYIAVPITARTLSGAFEDIDESIARRADIIELRIDFQRNLIPEALEAMIADYPIPKIVTNRHRSEAGPIPDAGFTGSEAKRMEYLRQAIALGVEYVDIEAGHFQTLDKKRTKVISSYNNFFQTPKDLFGLYRLMRENNHSDIIKIAVKANTKEDVGRMVELIENAESPIIGICTGNLGRTTRLHPKNYLTYAALDNIRISSPGQYTIEEVKELLRR